MNTVGQYEYDPMPILPGEPLRYRFTRSTSLNSCSPWETGPCTGPVVDKSAQIQGAWQFAYRKTSTKGLSPLDGGALATNWKYIYHVTLVDGYDGWVEPSMLEQAIDSKGNAAAPVGSSPVQIGVVFAIIGVCLLILRKEIKRWLR